MLIQSVFAKNVRKIRLLRGLTQEKLAERSGLHVTYINAVERERRNISLDNIARIANALEIEAYKLLQDSEEITKERID